MNDNLVLAHYSKEFSIRSQIGVLEYDQLFLQKFHESFLEKLSEWCCGEQINVLLLMDPASAYTCQNILKIII